MIRFAGRFSVLKVAATLAAVTILIGTGWGAEKMYQKFFTKVSVTLERPPTQSGSSGRQEPIHKRMDRHGRCPRRPEGR